MKTWSVSVKCYVIGCQTPAGFRPVRLLRWIMTWTCIFMWGLEGGM